MVEFKMTEEERKKFDVVDDLKRAVFNLRTEIESKDKKHASLVKMASKNLAQLCKQAGRITELEAQRDELLKTADEMLKLIENSDFENDDMAPNNDDMNRWHRSVTYADPKFEASDREAGND